VFVEQPPSIESFGVANGAFELSWSALAGRTYRVQYKTNLNGTTWTDLVPDILATGPTATATNLIDGVPERFYRVLLLP
jgi:hypothetical protein